jgi:hypothetical protein
MMIAGPPEHPQGQETEPPDVPLAVKATIKLLNDIAERGRVDDDLMLRLLALRAALRRLRDHLEQQNKQTGVRAWLRAQASKL